MHFNFKSESFQLTHKFTLPEHLFVRVVQKLLQRFSNTPFPCFNRKLLKEKLSVRF